MTSAYIEGQRREAASARNDVNTKVNKALTSVAARPDVLMPPQAMMNIIGSHDRSHFVGTIYGLFPELVRRGNVSETDSVLDIGSGCGRMALPFLYYLLQGQYFGVDVWPEGVSWCQTVLTAENERFSFHLLETANNYYFEKLDEQKRNQFRLKFLDNNSIKLAFAVSVFTHLIEADTRQYLEEISRTLKAKGIAYVTCFIIDRFFFEYVSETKQHTGVRPVGDGVYQGYEGQDFFVGYTMDRWLGIIRGAGLEVVSFEAGNWAKKPGAIYYQDTFVLVKASPDM